MIQTVGAEFAKYCQGDISNNSAIASYTYLEKIMRVVAVRHYGGHEHKKVSRTKSSLRGQSTTRVLNSNHG